ncbi:insulinase family protein [Vibrio maritimus]|uniref:insulinase family protein n=1 Tax=Vibrio maritimus TaxID=990268 RepID=UPI0040698A59
MKKLQVWFASWALLLLIGCSLENDTPIKPDPGWKIDKLDNGLTVSRYYKSDQPITLRLVVHAGSLQETTQQTGYAHFLEHLFFRVEDVPQQKAAKDALFQAGVSFGPDLNAFTFNEYTSYELAIDNVGMLNDALTWLAYVADAMHITQAMIEQEKGVVLGEMRLRRPDPLPYSQKIYDHLLIGTPLDSHDIIGNRESIENVDITELKAFYKKWYQPQNMELMIAGDWEQSELLAIVNRYFADIQKGEQPRRVLIDPVKFNDTPLVSEALPFEYAALDLAYPMPHPLLNTVSDQYVQLSSKFVGDIISNRISDLYHSKDILVQGLNAGVVDIHSNSLFAIGASFEETERTKIQQALTEQLASLQQHGISQDELDTVRSSWTSFNDELKTIIDSWTSKQIIDYKFDMMLAQSVAQDPIQYIEVHRQLATEITLEQVNQAIKKLLTQEPIIGTNVKNGSFALNDIYTGLKQKTDKPLELTITKALAVPSSKGKVSSMETLENGLVKWKLANGIEVLYLNHKDSGDRFYGWFGSLGGSSALTRDNIAAGQLIPLITLYSDIGPLTAKQIERAFSKTNSYVEPFIRDVKQGMSFGSNEKGIADVFSVVHHAMSLNDVDELAVSKAKNIAINELKRLKQDSNVLSINDALQLTFDTGSHLLFRTEPEVALVTKERVMKAYNELIKVNRGYKMMLVGGKSASEVQPLLEQYIANIQFSEELKYTWPTVEIRDGLDDDITNIDSHDSQDGQSQVYLIAVSERNEPRTSKDVFAEDMFQRLLNERIFQTIRSDNSLDYNPHAYGFADEGNGIAAWSFFANVDPKDEARAAKLFESVANDILNGFEKTERDQVVAQLKSDLAPWLDDPEGASFMLFRYWLMGYGIDALYNYESVADSITLSDLDRMSQQALGQNASKFSIRINP